MRDAVPLDVGRFDGPLGAPLVTPHGGPEALFGLGRMSVERGTARVSMATGRWLHDEDGRPAAGSLGVLLDDVLGQAVLAFRPDGCWSVTTELSAEFTGSLPADGSPLMAQARAVSADGAGGLASGTVRDVGDRVVAIGTTWARFMPGMPAGVTSAAEVNSSNGGPTQRCAGSLRELLRAEPVAGYGFVVPEGVELANPAGVLHGGVIAAAVEMTARRAFAGSALRTASLRVAYLRPAVGSITFTPRVVHAGRSLVVVEVLAHAQPGPHGTSHGTGKPCAVGTVSMRSGEPAVHR